MLAPAGDARLEQLAARGPIARLHFAPRDERLRDLPLRAALFLWSLELVGVHMRRGAPNLASVVDLPQQASARPAGRRWSPGPRQWRFVAPATRSTSFARVAGRRASPWKGLAKLTGGYTVRGSWSGREIGGSRQWQRRMGWTGGSPDTRPRQGRQGPVSGRGRVLAIEGRLPAEGARQTAPLGGETMRDTPLRAAFRHLAGGRSCLAGMM